jgi:hypothetical protein
MLLRDEMMADLAHTNDTSPRLRMCLVAAAASLFLMASLQDRAAAEDDVFQHAVNYVFTGRIDPEVSPEIINRKSCVVVVPVAKFEKYARYYLMRFKTDTFHISKIYAGPQVSYELSVRGDDIIVEYLNIDKVTIEFGLKSADIPLPGNIEQTERALHLIFDEYCKPEKPKMPF